MKVRRASSFSGWIMIVGWLCFVVPFSLWVSSGSAELLLVSLTGVGLMLFAIDRSVRR